MQQPNEEPTNVQLLRAGDQEVAKQLYDRYVDQLVILAKRRISQRLASRVDPEDIVQSVFRTFFQHAKEGEFELHDPDDLCKLLVRITIHKTLRQIAHHQRGKRDTRRETGQSETKQEQLLGVLGSEPGPDEAVIFLDELEHFFAQLTEEDRKILEMRMEGFGNMEIAEKLSINDRRIRRLLERIRGLARKEGLNP